MITHSNIIHVEEGGVSNPYVVHRVMSEFAQVKAPDGWKLVREQRANEVALLLCEPIRDAVWEDIPTDTKTESQKEPNKESHVDRTV